MELFVTNVPSQSTENSLRKFLKNYLADPYLRTVHIFKSRGRNFAKLTFLHIQEAQKFLDTYGQNHSISARRATRVNHHQAAVPQLIFLGHVLKVAKSREPVNPYLLRALQKEENDRTIEQSKDSNTRATEQKRVATHLPLLFQTDSISCGVWNYVGSKLVFEPQLTWDMGGTAKFGDHSMILTLKSGFRIDFLYFGTLCITTEEGTAPSLIFSMKDPPRFYQQVTQQSLDELLSLLNIFVGGRSSIQQSGIQRHRVPCLDTEHQAIAGTCLVYRLTLSRTMSIHSRDNTLSAQLQLLRKAQGLPRLLYHQTEIHQSGEKWIIGFRALRSELSSIDSDLPFEIRFQIQRLVQSGYLLPRTVIGLLPELRGIYHRNSVQICVRAIRKLSQQISWPGPETEAIEFELQGLADLLRVIEGQCRRDETGFDRLQTSNNQAAIHRVKITPTGILLGGPEAESNNRVLRKYPNHHDYFVRVSFCDEDGLPVRFNPRVSNEKIFHERFKAILDNGINIAGREYAFLGFSHSSLRSQSCWFMAPFVHDGSFWYDRILIEQLGNFQKIQSPAKCAARIGQVFSDTRIAVPVLNDVQMLIPDVEINGRVFSDGVGKMSEGVMHKIWDILPNRRSPMPTHFQIRYQGAKGMIALDTRLNGDVLCLRPSMIKFDGSTSPDIEICDVSYKPLPLYLNRQFIKILEDMGVKDSYFLNLQAKEVARLRSITESPINASIFLAKQSIGNALHLSTFINNIASLEIDFRQDGFLRDVLEMALLNELRLLKHKTRIPVAKGWHLHGLMDETGFLDEGQIFVTGMVDGKSTIIVGDNLIVTRAPALHPGDIQLAEAVSPPTGSPLRRLQNCVCFSNRGNRDLPSKLSGGDLDGDRYYVIWDEHCKPTRTFEPANYPRLAPVDIGRKVSRGDMTNFFIQFMETDQLGRIAVNHRVLSDQKILGTPDLDCIKLAEMHSTAVDFSKTGIPVNINLMPKVGKCRPDFEAPGPHVTVEKDIGLSLEEHRYQDPNEVDDEDDDFTRYRYYESNKVLGKLYREIDERAIFDHIKQRSQALGVKSGSTVTDRVWEYVKQKCSGFLWEHHLDWARDIREDYEEALQTCMIEYSEHPSRPITELEAFVGNILGKSGAQSKHQRELSTTMKEQVDDSITFIINCIVRDGAERSDESLERSMACLAASLEEKTKPPARRRYEQILSFKYVAASICLMEVERLPYTRDDGYFA